LARSSTIVSCSVIANFPMIIAHDELYNHNYRDDAVSLYSNVLRYLGAIETSRGINISGGRVVIEPEAVAYLQERIISGAARSGMLKIMDRGLNAAWRSAPHVCLT